MRTVLGEDRADPNGRVLSTGWRDVLDAASTDLPAEIANETFLAAEYALVVLPNRITTEAEYLRVRRPGRGVALDRAKRAAVWSLIAAYRAQSRIDGHARLRRGRRRRRRLPAERRGAALADHVLVDEGQDLSPAHWQLLRALAADGPDDLFIAEDSHQRIYGPRTVLGRYGIRIVGRSRRLTLNYRTTAQNLRYAMTILDGGDYVDLEEAAGVHRLPVRPHPGPHRTRSTTQLADRRARRHRRAGPRLDRRRDRSPDRSPSWPTTSSSCERVVNGLDRARRGGAGRRPRQARPTDRVSGHDHAPGQGHGVLQGRARRRRRAIGRRESRLAQLDESERDDAELRSRSLVYVAATRARDELTVMQRA